MSVTVHLAPVRTLRIEVRVLNRQIGLLVHRIRRVRLNIGRAEDLSLLRVFSGSVRDLEQANGRGTLTI